MINLLYQILAVLLTCSFLVLLLPIVVIASVYTGAKAFCKKIYQSIIDMHLKDLEEV